MDEFSFISDILKPLARGFAGSLGLSDDAAVFTPPPGHDLVVTKDAISEGIHFTGQEDPALLAQKLLRVNLSDLAAMGATPLCYFLALMLPQAPQPEWLARFAEGLAQDQTLYNIHLAGGDTIATRGFFCASLTALGTVPAGKALRRNAAQTGDQIYVSGTLGDSALGLALVQNRLDGLPAADRHWLEERYFLPQPRMALGEKLAGTAHAVMDISDGLLQDMGHICTASGTAAVIDRHRLPLSQAVAALIANNPALWEYVFAGGDDYELLFTVPADKEAGIEALSVSLGLRLTAIGNITEGSGVTLRDEQGQALPVSRTGYNHLA
jgi:thiamine-monophosphate kinase